MEDFSLPLSSSADHAQNRDFHGEEAMVERAKLKRKYFKPLYERYFSCIYGFVLNRVKDTDEANDITSQVFFKAMMKIGTFTFRNIPFSAWLYKIALNECNLFFRKAKRSKTVIIDEEALMQISVEVEDQNLAWRKEKLIRVLQMLNQKEMDLIELRFHLGMSYKEIACVINSSEINARVRLHRVVSKIKENWVE